jgi:hypothetical protein
VAVEAFDPIVIKVKGDASDVLVMLAALKKAVHDFEGTSKTTGDKVSDDFKREGKAADEFGRLVTANMREGKTAMESLRAKSVDLRGEVVKLREEFGKTGSKSVFGDLRQAESDLKKIDSYVRSMARVGSGSGGGRGGLGGFFRNLFSQAKATMGQAPEGGGVIAGLSGGDLAIGGGALLPGLLATVAATVNAGLISGVGMGGLALGIKAQMQNPVVAGSWQYFLQEGKDALTQGSSVLAGPLRDAFGSLGEVFRGMNLRGVFAPLAAEIRPLEQGFALMVDRLLPGLHTAMANAAPFLHIIAQMLPSIGDAVTAMFNDISKGAGGGKLALQAIIVGLDGMIRGIGLFVRYGSDAFAWFVSTLTDVADDMAHFSMEAFGWIPGLGGKLTALDKTTGKLRDQVNATARSGVAAGGDLSGAFDTTTVSITNEYSALAALNDQMDTMLGNNLSLAQAQLALATDQATESFKRGKHAFDEHYAAGRANMTMLLGMVGDLKNVYDADVKINGITPQNTKAYQDGITTLLANAKAAGATSSQIDALRQKFLILNGTMTNMNGLTTNLYVNVHSSGMAGFAGGKGFYAQSGVHHASARAPEHYDRSGVYAGRPGGYVMGESSTGDEALIGRMSNPGRAVAALVTAASWYQMAVTPSRAAGMFSGVVAPGGAGGGGGGMAMADVYLDTDKVGYAMVRWSGRFQGRSGVTIAGATTGTTVGQAR